MEEEPRPHPIHTGQEKPMEDPDSKLHPADAELTASAYCFKIGLSVATISAIVLSFQWLHTVPEQHMTLTFISLSTASGWTLWWGRNLLTRYADLKNRLKEPIPPTHQNSGRRDRDR